MALPINKQPVVHPGSKLVAFGWPFHGLVEQVSGVGTLTLDSPASPATKIFPSITELVVDNTSTNRWYIGWNCTNTTMIKRPGWPDPARSVEEQALDVSKGYKWKPYMLFVGPRNRMSGTDEAEFGWNRFVYIDSTGVAYAISYTTVVTTAGNPYTVRFRFRIAELVVTVTRDPDERVVDFFFTVSGSSTDFFKTIILDRTNTGNKLLILLITVSAGLIWDSTHDLPKVSNGGGFVPSISEFVVDWEITVTGDGIDNIAFTVTADPRDEKTASFTSTPNPTFTSSEISGFFYDDAGIRQPITRNVDAPVTNTGVFTPAFPDNAYQWTVVRTTTIDYGGLYSAITVETTEQTAVFDPPNPLFVQQDRKIEGDLVDSDTASGVPGAAITYDVVTNLFEQVGAPTTVDPQTTAVYTTPWLSGGGERIRRIAQGYLSDSGDTTSGIVIYDDWLDKKNGTVVASLSGWTGSGFPGFYEFAAYDPETGDFVSVVYAGNTLPAHPAAFDVKYYV